MESLENRLLLAADLWGQFGMVRGPEVVVPGDRIVAPVVVHNSGDWRPNGRMHINLYASQSGQIDEDAILVASREVKANIKPGGKKQYNMPFRVNTDVLPGYYSLFAQIDPYGQVEEWGRTDNNTVTTDRWGEIVGGQVVWAFGNVPGRGRARFHGELPQGGRFSVAMTGRGWGEIVLSSQIGPHVRIYAQGNESVLARVSKDFDMPVPASVLVDGSLKSFRMVNLPLTGNFSATGSVGRLDLAGVEAPSGWLGMQSAASLPGQFVAARGGIRQLVVGDVNTPVLFSAESFGNVQFRGNADDVWLWAGLDFGGDGMPGGTGFAADSYGPGAIRSVMFRGDHREGAVIAGLDPVDGVFFNGDDRFVDGASRIGKLTVRGSADDSVYLARDLPARVVLDGQRTQVDPSQPRFIIPGTASGFALYASGDTSGTSLGTLHPATGEFSPIGGSMYVAEMDFRSDGTLFGATSMLFTIDTTTGLRSIIGDMPELLRGLSFGPADSLYGLRNNFADPASRLYQVDPSDGSWSSEVTISGTVFTGTSTPNPNEIVAIDFAPDGTLYGIGYGLYTINPATGLATRITPLNRTVTGGASGTGLFLSLDWGPDNLLRGITNEGDFYSIDPATGTGTPMWSGLDLQALASRAFD